MGEAVLYCVGASPYVIPAWRPSILYIRRLCDHIWIGRLTCTCLPYVLVWNLYRGVVLFLVQEAHQCPPLNVQLTVVVGGWQADRGR